MTRAVSVCTVAAVTLALGGTAGCGIKLRQVPHGDVDTSTPPGLRSQQLIDMLNSNWPIGKQGVATMAAANKVDDYTEIMTKLWVDRPYKVSSVDLGANSSTVHLIAPYGANVDIGLRTNDKGDVDRLVPYQQPPTIANWSDVDAALSASGGRYSYRLQDRRRAMPADRRNQHVPSDAPGFGLQALRAVGRGNRDQRRHTQMG